MAKQTWRMELSYDADSDYYKHGHKMRISLIKFLIKYKAYRLRSYVGSTIAFSCDLDDEEVFSYWEININKELGEDFYYMLSILTRPKIQSPDFAMIKKSKPDFEANFEKDVETAEKELKTNPKF